MKTYLVLILMALTIGCGSTGLSSEISVDDSPGSSQRLRDFAGTVVWEFGKELKPWGITNNTLIRLIDDKPSPQIYQVPPSTLMFNKTVISKNLFKGIFAFHDNTAVFLELIGNSFNLKEFDGIKSVNIFNQPVNGKVVHSSDMTKPAVSIVWDDFRKQYLFTAALDEDSIVKRFSLKIGKDVETIGVTSTSQFIPVPDDGYVIEGTDTPELSGNLVSLDNQSILLQGCFSRYILNTPHSYYISNNKAYKIVNGEAIEIGNTPPMPLISFFGVEDGEPFTLVGAGVKKVRVAFFKQ